MSNTDTESLIAHLCNGLDRADCKSFRQAAKAALATSPQCGWIRLGLPRPGAEALEATPVAENHKKRQNVRWLTDVWGNAFKIADDSFQEQRGDKAILSRIRCATKLVASRSGYLASCRWRCAREGTDGSA